MEKELELKAQEHKVEMQAKEADLAVQEQQLQMELQQLEMDGGAGAAPESGFGEEDDWGRKPDDRPPSP